MEDLQICSSDYLLLSVKQSVSRHVGIASGLLSTRSSYMDTEPTLSRRVGVLTV